jgi:hypothetical protein
MVANTLQLGKHAENALGIGWEQRGKLMGTHWKQQRSNSPPSPKRQKKHGPPGCMESPHWLQEGFFACPYSLPFLA